MRVINMKIKNIKINSSIKIIAIMTLIIFTILIILPLIFLRAGKESINVFNLNNENIVKSTEILFPINGKVKLLLELLTLLH